MAGLAVWTCSANSDQIGILGGLDPGALFLGGFLLSSNAAVHLLTSAPDQTHNVFRFFPF